MLFPIDYVEPADVQAGDVIFPLSGDKEYLVFWHVKSVLERPRQPIDYLRLRVDVYLAGQDWAAHLIHADTLNAPDRGYLVRVLRRPCCPSVFFDARCREVGGHTEHRGWRDDETEADAQTWE